MLKIRRAIDKFEEASQSKEICQRYPEIKSGLYNFLGVEDVKDAKQFTEIMAAKGKEVYAIRQEKGTEYVPLVDLYNILQDIGEYQDVVDNIPEFKLLLKYPNLTPYMFSFIEMKPATITGLVDVANRDYVFRDDTDFILNYYKPIHDNFGISDRGIGSILRNAEKKARQNRLLNNIDEKFGKNNYKRKISKGAELIHWLVYWPIFLAYFLFEVAKTIFTSIHYLVIPIFVILFGFENWLLPKYGVDNLLVLRKIFFKDQWLPSLEGFMGVAIQNNVDIIYISIVRIIWLLAIYILPPLFASLFISEFSDDLNKHFDWIGIERTFQQVIMDLRKKTEELYIYQRKSLVKKNMHKIIINIVCMVFLIAIFVLIAI